MRTGLVLIALLALGCGPSSATQGRAVSLTSVNGHSTYRACLRGATDVGLGGVIVALTADGTAPTLDGTRVVEPARDVHVERVEIDVEPGTVDVARPAALMQVVGLDSAFAVPVAADHRRLVDFAAERVTARPDGALGPAETLGWYSLVVPVRALGPELRVYDMVVHYRVGDGEPVAGSLSMQWHLCLDDCASPCGLGTTDEQLRATDTERVTVFEAGDREPWEVATELPG